MKISICIPSFRRPKVKTLDYINFAKVYVDESEVDQYEKENPEIKIISCKSGIHGNISRVRNHILKTEFEKGYDCVVMLDDDIRVISRYINKVRYDYKKEEIENLFLKCAVLARDWRVYLWGFNCSSDPQNYREYTPFSTVSFIGGPVQGIMIGGGCWYDERLSLKEDYDMTIQQLYRNRCVLRFNYLNYTAKQFIQQGGCAVYRNLQEEKKQLELLKKKWGDDIVKVDVMDRSHKSKKKKNVIDYNPIIRVPIPGV